MRRLAAGARTHVQETESALGLARARVYSHLMETERSFTLPRGYVDSRGTIHREGLMRLARASDEILPLEDPRVKGNRAYLVILLISRVVTRLGDLEGDAITPAVIEGLFAGDLAYLQKLYVELNGLEGALELTCPHCGKSFRPAPGS